MCSFLLYLNLSLSWGLLYNNVCVLCGFETQSLFKKNKMHKNKLTSNFLAVIASA